MSDIFIEDMLPSRPLKVVSPYTEHCSSEGVGIVSLMGFEVKITEEADLKQSKLQLRRLERVLKPWV